MALRWYQDGAVQAVWRYWKENPEGNPLVCLPCGAGKTHVIAGLVKKVLDRAPDRNILVLSPRRELVAQTYEKLAAYMPFVDAGIVSAGLGRKDFDAQVIVAGIQSVYKRAEEIGPQTLVIVDEAQWLPPDGDGMFRSLLAALMEKTPRLKLVGLTATPWRTSTGVLTQEGSYFSEIVYEADVLRLVEEGHLCRLTSKAPRTQVDLSKVSVRAGEYVESEMEAAFNHFDVVQAAISEVARYAGNRSSWLFFCSGKEHAKSVTNALKSRGHAAECILGDTPSLFRDEHVKAFKERRLKCLVGCQVFTEGFDATNTDLIVLLRGTKSPGLYYQMVGRGMRTDPGKDSTLILDFAGVIQEHGPIDKLKVGRRWNSEKGKIEDTVVKEQVRLCPECRSLLSSHLRECPDCGYAFLDVMRLNHQAEVSSAPILSTEEEPTYDVDVYRTDYERHKKRDKPLPTLRADYSVAVVDGISIRKVSEWVCFEHPGFAGDKARRWWMDRGGSLERPLPQTVDEALQRTDELRAPKKLRIKRDGQYWRILKVLEFHQRGEGGSGADEAEDVFDELGINF